MAVELLGHGGTEPAEPDDRDRWQIDGAGAGEELVEWVNQCRACRIGVVLARGSGGERCDEGDGSDAAHEHEDAEEDLRGTAEVSGDAGGEADGGEGGDDLEMDLVGAELRVEGTEARDNECYDTYCHSTDSESLADHGVINATTADDSIFFTPNFCHDRREHHEERGDLQATCGTAGSASNEHQNVGTHQGIGRHLAKVHGLETSGTGRNGLKHCRQGSIPAAQPGECMITLERPEHHEATDEEHRGAVESDPSGHRQPRWFPPLPAQAHPRDKLVEHRKAEPAEDNRQADRQDDPCIADVGNEATGVQPETGVIEGRDGVEDTHPCSGAEAIDIAAHKHSYREDARNKQFADHCENDGADMVDFTLPTVSVRRSATV